MLNISCCLRWQLLRKMGCTSILHWVQGRILVTTWFFITWNRPTLLWRLMRTSNVCVSTRRNSKIYVISIRTVIRFWSTKRTLDVNISGMSKWKWSTMKKIKGLNIQIIWLTITTNKAMELFPITLILLLKMIVTACRKTKRY